MQGEEPAPGKLLRPGVPMSRRTCHQTDPPIILAGRLPSISLWLRPRHRELVAAADIAVAVEMEPHGDQEVERHHRDQLRAEAEEDGEEGHHAEAEQHDGGNRM